MPAGRPTDYNDKYCEVVKELLYDGACIYEVCRALKKSRQCINEWRHKHKEFGDTFTEYLDYSQGWWMEQGRKNLGNKDFNARLYELNMHNRFGWNKKSEQSHNVEIKESTAKLEEIRKSYGRDY